MRKELKVGERVTLEVVEKKGSCEGCFFYNSSSCSIMLKCTKFVRSDKKAFDSIQKEFEEL